VPLGCSPAPVRIARKHSEQRRASQTHRIPRRLLTACCSRRPFSHTAIATTDTHTVYRLRRGNTNMSSLSRRACFKCGNVGHYAGKPPRALAALPPWDTQGACRDMALSSHVPASPCTRCATWIVKDTRLTYWQRCARRLRGSATTVGPTPPPRSTVTDQRRQAARP
jgi:hypothetical protein